MDLRTTAEAAEFLHIPLATLRHWIATGQAPPSAKIGRRRMFRNAELLDFVQSKFDLVELRQPVEVAAPTPEAAGVLALQLLQGGGN